MIETNDWSGIITQYEEVPGSYAEVTAKADEILVGSSRCTAKKFSENA